MLVIQVVDLQHEVRKLRVKKFELKKSRVITSSTESLEIRQLENFVEKKISS